MWDFSIQTDHVVEAHRLGLVVFDKKRTCKIIDFAIPVGSRIEEKEKDKMRKVSRLQKGVSEDLECESEDYTDSCELFRWYT